MFNFAFFFIIYNFIPSRNLWYLYHEVIIELDKRQSIIDPCLHAILVISVSFSFHVNRESVV